MSGDEGTGKPNLLRIAEHLERHGVEFVVIGGQAAAILGSALPTYDVDLCYRRTKENLERLAIALRELNPSLRGAPEDLPFRLDAVSQALGSNFTFNTDFGPLEMLGWVEPLGTYDSLLDRCEWVDVGSTRLRVIGLEDLMTIKQHLGRAKDKLMLLQLQALKELRDKNRGGI